MHLRRRKKSNSSRDPIVKGLTEYIYSVHYVHFLWTKTSELHSNLKIPGYATVEADLASPYRSEGPRAHTQSGDAVDAPSP